MRRFFRSLYDFAKQVAKDFSEDNGSLVAAAISFYVFLSLIPVLLLAVATVGYLLGSPERARQIVFSYMSQYSPSGGPSAQSVVESVVRGRASATGFSIIALLWSGTWVMANLETAINVAWNVREKRGFFLKRLIALSMLMMAGVLFGASFGITTAFAAIKGLDIQLFGAAPADWSWVWKFLEYLIPFLVTIAAFTLVYKILPNTLVRLRAALVGGVFAGILWEVAKIGLSYYVTNFTGYSIYGSLGGIIVLLVWIYYSSVVTILGAEVASLWSCRHGGDLANDG